MGRAPCCEKNGLKKGPWTPEEDQKLIDYINKHGHGSWRTLPKNAGLQRCGKSCRLRWTNYLRPDIKRGRFSFEEEETIIQLHSILGNKWSAIAGRLPGRTDNEIKNYWNTHIRKRLLRMGIDPVTHSPRFDLLDLSSVLYNSSQFEALVNPELLRLATTLLSSQRESLEFLHHNLHENQLCDDTQLLNQLKSFQPNQLQTPLHEISTCTTSATPFAPIFPSKNTTFSYQDTQSNFWQEDSGVPCNLTENLVSLPSCYNYYGCDYHQTLVDPLSENSTLQPNNDKHYHQTLFNFPSVLSTPSSSPTPLNSSSTHINSSTEDERDSYCSKIPKFEIPDGLDVNEFM